MHAGANVSALRVPVHGATGIGERQRKSPIGGAANGRPLYTLNSFSLTPDIAPDSVMTRCATATPVKLGCHKSYKDESPSLTHADSFSSVAVRGKLSDVLT